MEWPFKWNLSTCIYTWCYLFFKISQNGIWDFLLNLTFRHIWQWQGKNWTMWYVNTNLHCHQCSIFIKLEFACLQIFIELLKKWKKKRFNMNKRIFVSKKFSHCGITELLKSNVIIVMVITSGEILDKPRLTWVWYWSRCFFWRTAKLKR